MIDIVKLPIVLAPAEQEMRNELQALSHAGDEGYIARRMGARITECPPFRLPELRAAWRLGWRQWDRAEKALR